MEKERRASVGLRQQLAEAVGLTNHPTVHVIATKQQQVSVTASEGGAQKKRDGYAFRTCQRSPEILPCTIT